MYYKYTHWQQSILLSVYNIGFSLGFCLCTDHFGHLDIAAIKQDALRTILAAVGGNTGGNISC